jgi:DNA repair exonuclease SbcCD ATPase subunit
MTLFQIAARGMRTWLLFLCIEAAVAYGQDVSISSREIVERLTRLEEGQKALLQRLEDSEKMLHQRIDAVQQRLEDGLAVVNQRFEAVNQRFEAINQRFDAINQRFDTTDKRISELREFLLWGFGVTFAGIFALVGFVLWDRRTALTPAVRRIDDLSDREHRLEAALREYARGTSNLADALRKYDLL